MFVQSVGVFKKWHIFKASFRSHEYIFWQGFVMLPWDPLMVTKRIGSSEIYWIFVCVFWCCYINCFVSPLYHNYDNYFFCENGSIRVSVLLLNRIKASFPIPNWILWPQQLMESPPIAITSPWRPHPGHPGSLAGDYADVARWEHHQVGFRPSGNQLAGGPPRTTLGYIPPSWEARSSHISHQVGRQDHPHWDLSHQVGRQDNPKVVCEIRKRTCQLMGGRCWLERAAAVNWLGQPCFYPVIHLWEAWREVAD